MPASAPILDHVVIDVRDRMDVAAAAYRALGFQLTPRGHHTLGSMNHLAMFANDYLELLGFGEAVSSHASILGHATRRSQICNVHCSIAPPCEWRKQRK